MKPSIFSTLPIPGWDCTLLNPDSPEAGYTCSPSDEYIAVSAYYEWLSTGRPEGEAAAVDLWVAGIWELIVAQQGG